MSKEVYDACRRYKHFYKKNEEVKSWDKKYHDIDLSDAINKTNMQLMEARHGLQDALLNEFNVGCVSIERVYDEPQPIFTSDFDRLYKINCCGGKSIVEFRDSWEFIDCLTRHLHKMMRDR